MASDNYLNQILKIIKVQEQNLKNSRNATPNYFPIELKNKMNKIILMFSIFSSSYLYSNIKISRFSIYFKCPCEFRETSDSLFIENVCSQYFSAHINKFSSHKYYGIDGDSLLIKTSIAINKKNNKGVANCISYGNSFYEFDANGYIIETYEIKKYKLNGNYKAYDISKGKKNQKCVFEGFYKNGKLHGFEYQYSCEIGSNSIYSKKLYKHGKLIKSFELNN